MMIGTPGYLWPNFPTRTLTTLQQNNHHFSVLMEEIRNLTQLTSLKTLLLESYLQKDITREPEVSLKHFKRDADKSRESPPFSTLVKWYGFPPRSSNELNPLKNFQKDGWVLLPS
ncbi:hypothetical protein O181_015040 [Austropuccinia psidii MF-1]|uniref:Uncharacterized protein n=1 Tax=Austropuccinia psidii MF-1 TaxID=1389203 RepID=A0A9Q3C241_9BASI|nr:hypothetical protein [Austropuccinia psidii MF-1]